MTTTQFSRRYEVARLYETLMLEFPRAFVMDPEWQRRYKETQADYGSFEIVVHELSRSRAVPKSYSAIPHRANSACYRILLAELCVKKIRGSHETKFV
jgi:hypothetical protein